MCRKRPVSFETRILVEDLGFRELQTEAEHGEGAVLNALKKNISLIPGERCPYSKKYGQKVFLGGMGSLKAGMILEMQDRLDIFCLQ